MNVADAMRNIHEGISRGPFEATWDSLRGYQVPSWYLDGKFGIFIHWGVYCVPAFGNEWYPRQMYLEGNDTYRHHLATYGPHAQFGYKDFIPKLTAERYDPAAWADLFRQAGARFVVPVAEHHDGFAMYDCGWSEWCAAKMGPRRDLVGELAEATRAAGLVFGVSSHRAEHWWFFDGGTKFDSDVRDPRYAGLYGPAKPQDTPPDAAFLDDWLLRCCELIDRYHPQLFWFDWWIEQPVFRPYLQKFAAYYYNRGAEWGKGVAINYKNQAFPEEAAVFDIERGQLTEIRERFWQTDTSVSKNSWGYITHHDYKTAGAILGDLVDIVSKNGALLLSIGPRPDGTIPEPEQELLREIGRWLAINGEAIYGTRPWVTFGEGPTQVVGGTFNDTKRPDFSAEDVRFTVHGEQLYAICLGVPVEAICIRALRRGSPHLLGPVRGVRLLGSDEPVRFRQEPYGLVIEPPSKPPCAHAVTYAIER